MTGNHSTSYRVRLAPGASRVADRPRPAAATTHPAEVVELAERVVTREPTRYERYVKPVVDRVGGALLLLAMAPVLLVTALVLFLTLGSPILIRQDRIGRGGRIFGMLKFRTMRPDRRRSVDLNFDGDDRRMTHKSANDPRHTRLGRKLRRSSIDELPQLLNVVRGDMSLVGPRPELRGVVDDYHDWQHLRHAVRPGLTGLWQVTERANGTLLHEHTELDLEYVQHVSARTDARILVRTPFALLRQRGVH